MNKIYAVIMIRSPIGVRRGVVDTLKMLRLKSINNCVLVPENPESKGMIEKIKDVITYGEVEENTLVEVLKKRMRLKNGERVDEKSLKESTDFDKFENFAKEISDGKIKLKDFENVQPVFRLTPPSKGFNSIKIHYPKGDLGYRGKEINELLRRMI